MLRRVWSGIVIVTMDTVTFSHRKFDCRANTEVQSIELSSSMVTNIDLSWDGSILTIAHGDSVTFLQCDK